MSDEINALMRRCVAAHRRCDEAGRKRTGIGGTSEDFQILYGWGRKGMPWRVGFYERDQGKQVEDGATLSSALRKWLGEYEDAWT